MRLFRILAPIIIITLISVLLAGVATVPVAPAISDLPQSRYNAAHTAPAQSIPLITA